MATYSYSEHFCRRSWIDTTSPTITVMVTTASCCPRASTSGVTVGRNTWTTP